MSQIANQVRVTRDNVRLTKPFRYFLGELRSLPYARVTITTETGQVGVGEVACAFDINGEDARSAMKFGGLLQAIVGNQLIHDTFDVARIMRKVNLELAHNPALKCGVEQALFHVVAQRTGRSMAGVLGPLKRSAKIQCTMPYFDSIEDYAKEIEQVLQKKPSFVKFKVGKNFDLEAASIHLLHGMDPSVQISIDANQGFSTSHQAVEFVRRFREGVLSWVEQPLAREDVDGLRWLRRRTNVPIMLDETIHNVTDAQAFLSQGLAEYVNIKPAKHGGIGESRKIIEVARDYGVKYMLGSMVHGPVGLPYVLAFALTDDFVTQDFYSAYSLPNNFGAELIDPHTLTTTPAVLGQSGAYELTVEPRIRRQFALDT